jgi:uncharacterized protein (TIGR02453 family)
VRHFGPGLFRFLRDLRENNRREWFEENRERFLSEVREPAQRFIMAVGERLPEVSDHLRADPRPQGGSMFRIHRDIRFSSDKSPYKTAVGIQFRHARSRDAHAPGLYLHLEPGECFVGVGAWRPERAALRAIRDRIAEDPEGWLGATRSEAFTRVFELGGEALKRGPRDFDPEHPLIADIKRKDFVGIARVPQSFATSSTVVDDFITMAMSGRPLMAFLCRAVDAPF